MLIIARLIWMVFLTAMLAGCAHFSTSPPPPPPAADQAISWDNRVQVLSNIQTWNLNALIAIRNNAKTNGDSANLSWQQTQQQYTILLFGPLGTNTVKLTGRPGHVLLEKSNGTHFTAVSPEVMLAQQTGWNLPVSSLYYWVRGLTVPNVPAQSQFDSSHHLIELVQQGWRIHFLRYASINHIDLPDKIFLDNAELNVKIIIKEWRI